MSWSTSSHDVIPPVEFSLELGEAPTYLHALLRSENLEFRDPYSEVRENIGRVIAENESHTRGAGQSPSADVSPQRLRTWKKVFEEFGLLYVETSDQRLRTTALGRMILELHQDLAQRVAGANDHVASLAMAVLNRHVLRNPLTGAEYPVGSDVHPYRAIWRTARAFGDRVHWEELNRVLLHVLKEDDVQAAIDHIRNVRQTGNGVYDHAALTALGTQAVDDGPQTRRRITPWLTRAGFGGTFLADDGDGYWSLAPEYLTLIDGILATPVTAPAEALTDSEAYLNYLISGLEVEHADLTQADEQVVDGIKRIVERFGSTKIIALSGIPGTGKTRLARLVAAGLTDNDPYRLQEIQFHDGTTYDKFVEGYVPKADGSGFSLLPMTLRVINERAARDPRGRTYVLLIEELTRADVHSVLGELLTYVEHRNRPFRLPLSQRDMRIAPNLVILATMNPRDRSALTLDHAILRRLHQIPVLADPAALRAFAHENLPGDVAARLAEWYDRFHSVLPFGHGDFASARSAEDLRDLWQGTLVHFLRDAAGELKQQYGEASGQFPWS